MHSKAGLFQIEKVVCDRNCVARRKQRIEKYLNRKGRFLDCGRAKFELCALLGQLVGRNVRVVDDLRGSVADSIAAKSRQLSIVQRLSSAVMTIDGTTDNNNSVYNFLIIQVHIVS